MIGDDRQCLQRRAGKPLRFPLACRKQPGKIGGGPEHPLAAGPHEIDAARRIFGLERIEDRGCRDPPRHTLLDILLIEGLGRSKKQSLGDPHCLGQAILQRRALGLIDLSKELGYFSQSQILSSSPRELQPLTKCGKPSASRDLPLIQSGAKGASWRIDIVPSLAISSEAERVEARTVRRTSGVVQNSAR